MQGGAGLPSGDPRACAAGRDPRCSESAHLEARASCCRRPRRSCRCRVRKWTVTPLLPSTPPPRAPAARAGGVGGPAVLPPQVRGSPRTARGIWEMEQSRCGAKAAACTNCCPTSGTGGLIRTAVPMRIVVFTEQRQDVRRPVSVHYLLVLYF